MCLEISKTSQFQFRIFQTLPGNGEYVINSEELMQESIFQEKFRNLKTSNLFKRRLIITSFNVKFPSFVFGSDIKSMFDVQDVSENIILYLRPQTYQSKRISCRWPKWLNIGPISIGRLLSSPRRNFRWRNRGPVNIRKGLWTRMRFCRKRRRIASRLLWLVLQKEERGY